MRALVTGAGGFVGPHLVSHLIDAGDTVAAFDLSNGPDLRDRQGWQAVVSEHRPEVIYHLAGWSDVGGSWRRPWTAFEVNVMGTVAVLEAARVGPTGSGESAGGPVFVMISSADVYGLVDESDLPLTEAQEPRPRSPYGASKIAGEEIARSYHRAYGLPVIIARPFNHLGRGQKTKFAAASFAGQIAELEATGGGVVRHGDLSARRDLTDVHDIVRAYRLLAMHGEPGETYNICSGHAVSMQEVLDTLLSLSPSPIRGEIDESLIRPVDLPVLRGSHRKLTAATGWRPKVDLARTLRDVLDDARSRRANEMGSTDRRDPPVTAATPGTTAPNTESNETVRTGGPHEDGTET
ncbi:MAG: GDP-mannose 4,6-dehydratase [Acidimicrobiia bacterium]|nr:GDP-mannose 4,6-dehydratase [Acidimicrobiia bacterium]